jgi:adenylyl cyclase-associated protein
MRLTTITIVRDKNHVEWVHAFVSLLVELQAYVKKNHTTGLVWNPQGGDAAAVNVARKPASPPQKPASPPTAASPVKPSMGALFGELNKGGEITSGSYLTL